MLDICKIKVTKKQVGNGRPGPNTEYRMLISPELRICRSKDVLVRGGAFEAVWDESIGLWSRDLFRLYEILDEGLYSEAEKLSKNFPGEIFVETFGNANTGHAERLTKMFRLFPDSKNTLDNTIAFSNTDVKKSDYISIRLSYPLLEGSTKAFHTMFNILYDDENLQKIMWAIGSVLSGESRNIQKFYVLYGKPGTGKSTLLDLIGKLTEAHAVPFSVEEIGKYNSSFALESIKDNPLVAIDHEGDLSRIETNGMLNSLVAHDSLSVNVKYRGKYHVKFKTTIFVATNKPVKITDSKSGITRRLVDIVPTGVLIPYEKYAHLVDKMNFELGGIAHDCIKVFKNLGREYYDNYRPMEMMAKTNHLFDFVSENAFIFERVNMVKRSEAWKMYVAYCESAGIRHPLPRYIFKDQFSDYWDELKETFRIEGKVQREVYVGFRKNVFKQAYEEVVENVGDWLDLIEQPSIFDKEFKDQPAQYVLESGALPQKWDNSSTKLSDIHTSTVHMVRPPKNLVMIDFDLKDESGEKSLERNIEAARSWPPTYAETSKSGKGLHLHYYYTGDVTRLTRIFSEDIEVKPPIGKFAIRRALTVCNNLPIATLDGGLPLKPEGEHMINRKYIADDRSMRELILKNIAKTIHPHAAPSINFIYAILEEGHDQGLKYDLRDLKPAVIRLAESSSNQRERCLDLVDKMIFKSDGLEEELDVEVDTTKPIVFFDMEVFPNLLIISWKVRGEDSIFSWFNPSRQMAASLLDYNLVGFNNRGYDNHILWGWISGDTNEETFQRSSRIIDNRPGGTFAQAYSLSYADVHSFSSVKQSLKKWEVDLGLPFDEFDHPWDMELPEELWKRAAQYCENDVRATESVFEERHADFTAISILAALSGLTVNDSVRRHVEQIIFGGVKEPQPEFNIPDLSKEFPGYTFDQYQPKDKKSLYRGEYVGEGGYVWADPGIYSNVLYMDVVSMHPTSLVVENLFGPYTKNFSDLLKARVLIKEGKLNEAKQMFGGKLEPYLDDTDQAKDLAYALKLALNSVYGYTSTQKYDWAFKHPDNIDNVVAKRGALFMVDLKNALFERGSRPIHFKTDSVKIANYNEDDINFVKEFGSKYGYEFGVEGIFERMVLINDAVLAGKWKHNGEWDVVGARYAHPYVYKKLFTDEPIEFDDLVETKMVSGGARIFLEDDNGREFIGRIGTFCPMVKDGKKMLRVADGKESAPPGTKDYLWLPAAIVSTMGLENEIDYSYFDNLVEDAIEHIAQFGDAETFLKGE